MRLTLEPEILFLVENVVELETKLFLIDIDTSIISKNRKFFALHSGQYKEFIDEFRFTGRVFLRPSRF